MAYGVLVGVLAANKDLQHFLAEKIKTTLKKTRRSEMVVEEEKIALQQKLQFYNGLVYLNSSSVSIKRFNCILYCYLFK